jgi:uncharacterized membrane protein
MISQLVDLTTLPNLHPLLVHFPIAFWAGAIVLDLACMLLRRSAWLDRAAATLYAFGAAGAGAAYLAGRKAEDSLVAVPATVQPLIAAHADWAWWTLLTLSGAAAVRLLVAWRGRTRDSLGSQAARSVVLLCAVAGAVLVAGTADRGGALVYRHGVAVTPQASKPVAPEPPPPSPTEGHLEQLANGVLHWTPGPSDLAALGSVLTPASGSSAEGVRTVESAVGDHGLALQVSGPSLLVLPGSYDDVQVEATLDLSGLHGSAGLAHHVQSSGQADLFIVSSAGSAALIRRREGSEQVEAQAAEQMPSGVASLGVSAVGTHLKGLLDGRTVVHGHAPASPAGRVGLVLDGIGTVRVLDVTVTPQRSH